MAATVSENCGGKVRRWREVIPRWVFAALLMVTLTGTTLLVARITLNWSIVPAAIFLGAMSGPLAFVVWVNDRTRVGRSVAPDVLFITFLVGGGVATIFVGIFESDFFYRPTAPGWLWIGLVEEIAKVLVPVAICSFVPRYRTVEHALALALMSAAGFAVMESMAYAIGSLDQSVDAARDTLLERSLVTPFGHLPWTAIAVIVGAQVWQQRQRIVLSPKALWGLAFAVAMHTAWDLALVEHSWWRLLVAAIAVLTFVTMYRLVSGVYYDGPYAEPTDHAARRRAARARR
jgi:RsiW-degrading membrane proteinase PrsW (M82 family)